MILFINILDGILFYAVPDEVTVSREQFMMMTPTVAALKNKEI